MAPPQQRAGRRRMREWHAAPRCAAFRLLRRQRAAKENIRMRATSLLSLGARSAAEMRLTYAERRLSHDAAAISIYFTPYCRHHTDDARYHKILDTPETVKLVLPPHRQRDILRRQHLPHDGHQ